MLYIIGLGLRGIRSLTLEGESAARRCQELFLESYTSIPPDSTIEQLEAYFGRPVKAVSRSDIEGEAVFLNDAGNVDIGLFVTGDPLSATTHNQLRYDLMKRNIGVEVLENASILTEAPSRAGIFHYRVAPPVSLPFCTDNFLPASVINKIRRNLDNSMHTMLLLDLNGQKPMGLDEAAQTLLKMEDRYKTGAVNRDTEVIVVSSLHMKNEDIFRITLDRMSRLKGNFGPSVVIITSDLNEQEKLFLVAFSREFRDEISEDTPQ